MKIIHTADLHLGASNNKLNYSQKKICNQEQISVCNELFAYAEKERVDIVLIAGDLFHSKRAPASLVEYFFNKVRSIKIPVVYVQGNHDEEFAFGDNLPENFKLLKNLTTLHFGEVDITGRSGTEDLVIPRLDEIKKNIVLLHGDIYSKSGDFIDLKALLDKNIDYLALGHFHSFEEKEFGRGKLCYSGCLFGNGFDECGQKGFVMVEIGEEVYTKFIPLSARRYEIVEMDITGLDCFQDLLSKLREKVSALRERDLVRVVLTGYFQENTEKYLSLLEREFSNQFYFEILDKSKLKIDFEKYKGEKLSFKAELLRLIDEDATLTEDEKSKISQLSIEALRGDDLSL